jgi:phosphatidylserine/phosphatidylglycerophosphate/cardiolipin synthase-like enzyme
MQAKVRVVTNNDIAYIWWSVPEKIPGCLGFSIHRQEENHAARALPAWVGFEKGKKSKGPKNTDVWPIQSFQWKDVYAPREGRFRYLIYAVKGTPDEPVRDAKPIVTTPYVALEEQFGKVRVTFNRGLLSTQALNRGSNAPAKNATQLRKEIGTANSKVRMRLTKELLPTLREPLRRAREEGGACYCALYELTDEELIGDLESTPGTDIVLSNANSSKKVKGKPKVVYDGTNAKTRKRLRENDGLDLTDRMLKGNSIGHNKFVIYEDGQRRLRSVLTGSTNWTATGLCGQTNNALLVDDEDLASHYHAYWQRLRNEQVKLQDQPLRTWARENPCEISLGHAAGKLKVWFSPNTKIKTKKADLVPVDMEEVFAIIAGAKKAVLFLLFNPGTPSIVDKVKEVAAARAKNDEPLFVRGAISDAKTAAAGAVRVFSRSIGKRADTVITGVDGVPDDFGYWERELLKLGHAAIHDKVLVVDPFSKKCVVVTGSHNLGFKASYANDENMLIIRGNRPIAEAFTAHVLDVVNHYRWRYKLRKLHKEGRLEDAWQDLEDDDRWENKYFDSGYLESRDRFLLS